MSNDTALALGLQRLTYGCPREMCGALSIGVIPAKAGTQCTVLQRIGRRKIVTKLMRLSANFKRAHVLK